MRIFGTVAGLILLLAAHGGAQLAAAESLHDGVSALFEIGSKSTAKSIKAAQEAYADLHKQSPGDRRVNYAFALVSMKQRQCDAAAKVLEMLLKEKPDDISAYRAKIWTEMLAKKYSAALGDMFGASYMLQKDEGAGETEESLLDLAKFLGRMFGYLEGPASGAVTESARGQGQKKILARLTPTHKEAFEAGRQELLAQYRDLSADTEETKAKAKADEEKQIDDTKSEIEKQKGKIESDQEKLEAKAEQEESKAKAELEEVNAQGRSVENQLAGLQAQAAPLIGERAAAQTQGAALAQSAAALDAERAALLRQAEESRKKKDNAGADRAQRQADEALRRKQDRQNEMSVMSAAIARLDAQLAPMYAQAARLGGTRDSLLGKRNGVVAKGQAESERKNRKNAELEIAAKALKRKEDKAKALKAKGVTAQVRALSAHEKAFTTYEEFPFEQEQDRILESLEKE